MFGNLTNALSRTADFSGKGPGPFGEIDSILNKFDLDFSFVTSLLSQFTEFADMFVAEQAMLSQEQNLLIKLRPRSLVGKYPALLNLGSKKTSVVYSSELKGLLWDKLVGHFPFSTYLGVQIPGLSIGETFREKHADRGEFTVTDYLPHLAIAFGKSFSFQDKSAHHFVLENLFAPDFSANLTYAVLHTLISTLSLPSNFSRFSAQSKLGMPMDPSTSEVFNVNNYLPSVQLAFGIIPSLEFAVPKFSLADLQETLCPTFPSLRAFSNSVKSKLVNVVRENLNGLFNTTVNLKGFDNVKLGGNTLSDQEFSWPIGSNKLFTPRMSIDSVQGFAFDLDVDVSDSGLLSLEARFALNVVAVNPIQTLSDISSKLAVQLQSVSYDFEGIASSMQSGFNQASTMFEDIASLKRIQLLLDANIGLHVNLKLPSFEISASLTEFDTTLSANIGKFFIAILFCFWYQPTVVLCLLMCMLVCPTTLYTEEDFSISLGGTNLSVRPIISLDLKAANTRLPINLISDFNHTTEVAFSGAFDAGLTIGVEGIPINLYVSASSDDITNSSGIDFHLGLDIDLFPVRDKIVDLLTKLNSISFGDNVRQDLKPFLPRLDFGCVSRSGSVFLLKNTANATAANYPVSGFLDAIATGCSSSSLFLSGGYNSTSEKLGR